VSWRAFCKIGVSVSLVGWLLWRTPLNEISTTLTSLDPAAIISGLLISLAAWWISAVRLWVLSPNFDMHTVVRTTLVALYYGTILPGQVAGDIMKAYRLSQTHSWAGEAVAAAVVDRVIATFALFLIAACIAPWVQQAPRFLCMSLIGVAIAIALGMYVLARSSSAAVGKRLSWLRKGGLIARLASLFAAGVRAVLREPRRLYACFALAVIFHAACLLIHIVLAKALGIDLSVASWFLVYSGVALLTLLPISVAGLGVREGGYVGLLAIFGITASQALALSLVFFGYIVLGALLGWIAEVTGDARPKSSARVNR
jgi:glycosyltransferase 2 family protein